ncbi:MAG: FAD-dependent oxidoreductase [Methyloprofundus sp.]|nr:FAD-dependent oxidoreductase [Methyloprofundus sp.]
MKEEYDVLIIGGGPAGSTAGAILAENGLSVAILEKENFPRFHIGESLLPASNAIWRRLGILDTLRSKFLNKPGGRWYYDDKPVKSHFRDCESSACFNEDPEAFMVDRSEFDKILLDNARNKGVEVLSNTEVTDLIFEGEELVGLKYKLENKFHEVRGTWTLDCSGLRGFISRKLDMRKQNTLKRLSVFAHYEAEALEDGLRDGWFVGGMIHDGWVWTIPLSKKIISIGVVASSDYYKQAASNPEEFISQQIETAPYFKLVIKPNPRRITEVQSLSNVGYTSEKLVGEGWALVGDAAYFIDPCYSSGVHFAVDSAQQVADILLESIGKGMAPSCADFSQYQTSMRSYEKIITRLVETFYLATTNKLFRKLVPSTITKHTNKKFATLTGGDFSKNHFYVHLGYYVGKLCHALYPDSLNKRESTPFS